MTLLDRIKSFLGFESNRSSARETNVDVSVAENEPDRTTDGGTGSTTQDDTEDWGVPPGSTGEDRDVQAGPEAFSDIDSTDSPETPIEEAESDDEDPLESDDEDSLGSDDEDSLESDEENPDDVDWKTLGEDSETSAPIEEAEPDADDHDLTDIKGIGPAYRDRLHDADVTSVAALIDADTAALAEATGLSETRVGRWQDRADALRE